MGSLPDITLAQIGTVVSSTIALLVAFGVGLSKAEQDAIVQVVSTLAPTIVAADALIRHGRSRSLAPAPIAAAAVKATPGVEQTAQAPAATMQAAS